MKREYEMFTMVLVMAVTAAIANDRTRGWLLSVLFGDAAIETLGLSSVEPEDDAEYADNVYQIFYDGYSQILHLSGVQVRNLIAYGHTVAYVS